MHLRHLNSGPKSLGILAIFRAIVIQSETIAIYGTLIVVPNLDSGFSAPGPKSLQHLDHLTTSCDETWSNRYLWAIISVPNLDPRNFNPGPKFLQFFYHFGFSNVEPLHASQILLALLNMVSSQSC